MEGGAQWDAQKGVWVGDKAAHTLSAADLPSPLWIFGYGSLCFKNDDIPAVETVNGRIRGYVRRFWQLSTDHRGTPQAPGLVCTLISHDELVALSAQEGFNYCAGDAQEEVVWGRAFRVPDDQRDAVLETLDFREKGGYNREVVTVEILAAEDGAVRECKALLYRGQVTGPALCSNEIRRDVHAQARVIARAVGPSGANPEYLFKLCEFLQ